MKTMKITTLKYKGIARAALDHDIENGYCDEVINLRFRDGKLKPVGVPTAQYGLPVAFDWTDPEAGMKPVQFEKIWKHQQNNINNFVGYTKRHYEAGVPNSLRLINTNKGTMTIIKEYDSVPDVVFLKTFMIVIYSGGMDRFIWKDEVYKLVNITERPVFKVYTIDHKTFDPRVFSSPARDAETVLSQYYAKLNEVSQDGYITGGFFIRAAFKMFDGSYIMHTVPRFFSVENFELALIRSFGENYGVSLRFYGTKAGVLLPTELYSGLSDVQDIVQSVVLFASKFETIIKLDDSIKDELDAMITPILEGNTATTLINDRSEFSVNSDFKKLHDSASWYKIAEYSISTILSGDVNEEIDLKGLYQDYATREVLPVDSFSHHSIFANAFNYNSRLILGDVSSKFGDYKLFPLAPILDGTDDPTAVPSGFVTSSNIYVRTVTTLQTETGTIKVLGRSYQRGLYANPSYPIGSIFVSMGAGELGYPDARATMIEVLFSSNNTDWLKSGNKYNLKKSDNDNYAYYINPTFNTSRTDHVTGTANYPIIMHQLVSAGAANLKDYPEQSVQDENRVQISELSNPFYFPAENSYQVGTGRVLKCAANTEPISDGQFGEYPLIVFTTKGTWAMLQGQGDILFSSIKPLSADVVENENNVVSTGSGVIYHSTRGIFYISGTNVQNISELLHGTPNFDIQKVNNYKLRINLNSLTRLLNYVSTVEIFTYLDGSLFGFDKLNNELVVTNPNYAYSYVFSFESNSWHKISRSFSVFVDSFPELLAVNSDYSGGIVNISRETASNVEAMVTTRPVKLENEAGIFSLLHRAVQRCELNTNASVFAGFYVFGSNDLQAWQLIAGNDRKSGFVVDIMTTRAHTKVKYFVFVFASTMNSASGVGSVHLQFYDKLTNKIR